MSCSCNDPVPTPPIPAQAIYAMTIAPPPGPGCSFRIPPSSVFAYPFWLCSGTFVEILAIHTAQVQDASLRLWISREPLGSQAIYIPQYLSFWEAGRNAGKLVTIHDGTVSVPKDRNLVAQLPPGPYFLNVLNLINSYNEFSLRIVQQGGMEGP